LKIILYPILLFFLISSSSAETLIKKFENLNDGNLLTNYVYNSDDYFFSLASTKVIEKSNKNILSTKTTMKALRQFKVFYKKKFIDTKKNISSDKIYVKKVHKIQNRTFKDHYIVVLAIPKVSVTYSNK
tara:strand:- start:257 stop:643 length:387 start_codon:yes stop_codon:yes gene_type:complete